MTSGDVEKAVRKLLTSIYPSGVVAADLRAELKNKGANNKAIDNGIYKLTSIGEAERLNGKLYLTQDPNRPPAKTVRSAPVTEPEITIPVFVKPKEAPVPAPEPLITQPERDALRQAVAPLNDPDQPKWEGKEREVLDLIAHRQPKHRVERADFKTAVLDEIDKEYGDPRLTAVLKEITQDLRLNAQ